MRFWGDDRAQSVQIGAVILFGFLIIALSLYQAQVVPSENAKVEFEHSQQLEGEFVDLRNSVLSTGRTGDPRSTSIKLGTRYPQRTFFVNPPPASGELSTSDAQKIRIDNATVDGEGNVERYWDNRGFNFTTKSIRYTPDYNEYRDPPDYLYEHSMAVAEFDGAVRSRTGQTAVSDSGSRISLTLVAGNLSESDVERRGIDPDVLSQNRRSIRLEPDEDRPVVITLPTTVESEEKRIQLAAAWNETLGSNANAKVSEDVILITIDTDEPVELRISQVGLGSDTVATDESDGYITKISKSGGTVVAEVRDRFNNPVPGAMVQVTVDGEDRGERTTDDDGRVVYQVDSGEDTVEMEINSGEREEWESVTFNDLIETVAGTGDNSYAVEWDIDEITEADGVSYDSDADELVIDRSEAGSDIQMHGTVEESGNPVAQVNLDYATSNPSIATFTAPGDVETNPDGSFTRTLDVSNDEGTTRVFAAAGDGVAGVGIHVSDDQTENGGTMAERTNIANDESESFGGGQSEVRFTIENTGTEDIDITAIRIDESSKDVDYVSGDPTFRDVDGDVYFADRINFNEDVSINEIIINGGDDIRLELGEFRRDAGSLRQNMNGETVEITLFFDDGSSGQFTIST